ncbi:MAG TPA: inosine/xanthosine triphosphatase [Candidatus Dormibacteraeota bacterium]|nr:inosine/xanthosine triphosphatase [Candidatus Dormibacteraeota bacterium]
MAGMRIAQAGAVQVAVGSLRAPKLAGARAALSAIASSLDSGAAFEVVGVDVPSGVGHTPSSREESMAGARNRAEALARLGSERAEPWAYFVGLEGGLDVIREQSPASGISRRIVFLESWAYVLDGSGAGAFGRSGGIELPETLAAEVLDEGVELSAAIDRRAGGQGIRNAQGAWGVLTNNLVTRQDAFRTAVLAAFAKFFNPSIYARQ